MKPSVMRRIERSGLLDSFNERESMVQLDETAWFSGSAVWFRLATPPAPDELLPGTGQPGGF